MTKSLIVASLLALSSFAMARPVASIKQVRTVYDGGSRGNDYFNSRLRSQMRDMGIRFVKDQGSADAVLRSNGIWTRAGGFSGSASLSTTAGKSLWSARVARAPRSREMAFDSLAAKLRAARR
jgi:hypothetical protein